ncbi:MAG: fibro-slime domain-containing protein [Mogibacterium sp.]|nr:fibro-slime domain-containing protein [Mogibacterium sp.]
MLPARTGTTHPATIDTVDNKRIGLTLNLFDYDLDNYLDDYFNNYNHGDHPVPANFLNHGINNNHNLKFWGSGIGNNHGSQNQYQEHGVTSIVKNTLDTGAAGGYPVLSTDNTSLDYLFTPSDGTDKKAYTNVNHLFKKDGDYYVYDSNENYAYYDPEQGSNGNFEVYNRTYKQKTGGEGGAVHTSVIGFFPFHKWDEEYDRYVNWNKSLNHHFGMSMSVPFSLPKDPKAVTDSEGNDIVFEFSGDDDLWVFIDGKLAMDIGGIHRPTSGTINFTQKKVVVNGSTQTGYSFPDNLYDGNSHTLQVFYIERGGCDSNCMIRFNLTRYGDVHFDKVDKENSSDKLRGALFGLYKDKACTQPLTENLKSGGIRAFVAESNASGRVQFQDVPLGTYYLKELRAPDGYPLDSTVHTVDVFLTENNDVQVKVTIDNEDVSSPGVQIPNKKPDPINVGLKKEWKDDAGNIITAPSDSTATFEIKRMRTYETYTEISTGYNGREAAHLTVGWIHDGQKHVYEEFDLVAESHVEVSWGYTDGYTGSKDCIVDDERIDKDYVDGNVVSYGFDMPGPNGNASLYIIDESDSGEAIRSIIVAGRQFYGNSGGGVIHEFKTFTEPDSEFTYTGENVEDNKVELPINSNTWQYDFTNLPVVGRGAVTVDGKQQNVTFKYSYYLEEKSSTSPAGTTVTYKDHNGKVINKPTDAEMHQTGNITVTNKVPTGYLQINKEVTFNGETPATDAQKSALAGTYTFKVFTDENCSKPYKVITGEAPNQQEQDLTLEIEIAADGTAKSSDKVKLPVGDYWIEEQNPTLEGVTPEANRLKVTVTKDNTTSDPAITSFTNNKEESDSPDELAIELEKTFTGLSSAAKIPANYQATLTYKIGAQPVTVPLTGTTQGNVTCTKSSDGMTWHWRVTQIPKTATDFAVSESNYDIDGYTRVTKINGKEVDNPGESHKVAVLVPEITMTNISRDYTTSDKKKVFEVKDNQILLVRMTNHATVIVSPKSLSKATRTAIEKMITDNDGKIPGDDGAQARWDLNFVYFSHEIQGDSFSYGGRTIYFEGDEVKIPHNASSHEVRVDINYKSESAENSFTIENDYTETPTEVDVLKVEKEKRQRHSYPEQSLNSGN